MQLKQQCVEYLRQKYRITHALASKLTGWCRTSKYYHKIMPEKDCVVKGIITSVIGSSTKGRNKVITLVQRKHPDLSKFKIRRVYQKEGFSLFKRPKKPRTNNICNPITIPVCKNKEWAMDFMSDALTNGRKFRTLNIIDHYDRRCVGIEVEHNFPARRVTMILDRIIDQEGKPEMIRTDNGPEFTSKVFQLWLKERKIKWSAIQKGAPQQNAIVERFNRTFREDVLDANLFASIKAGKEITEQFIWEYNNSRPHEALANRTQNEYSNAA